MTETVDMNSGASAEGVLHLAQKIYEEHVAAGEAIRAQAIAESEEEAHRILSNAETTAARLLDEAEKVHSEKTAAAEIEAENLVRESTQRLEEAKSQIALLQAFEAEYRKELRGLVDMASAILNPAPLSVDEEDTFENVDEEAPGEESDENTVGPVEEETSEESDVKDDVLDVDEDTEAEEAPVDEPVVEVEDTVSTAEEAEAPETELSEADDTK